MNRNITVFSLGLLRGWMESSSLYAVQALARPLASALSSPVELIATGAFLAWSLSGWLTTRLAGRVHRGKLLVACSLTLSAAALALGAYADVSPGVALALLSLLLLAGGGSWIVADSALATFEGGRRQSATLWLGAGWVTTIAVVPYVCAAWLAPMLGWSPIFWYLGWGVMACTMIVACWTPSHTQAREAKRPSSSYGGLLTQLRKRHTRWACLDALGNRAFLGAFDGFLPVTATELGLTDAEYALTFWAFAAGIVSLAIVGRLASPLLRRIAPSLLVTRQQQLGTLFLGAVLRLATGILMLTVVVVPGPWRAWYLLGIRTIAEFSTTGTSTVGPEVAALKARDARDRALALGVSTTFLALGSVSGLGVTWALRYFGLDLLAVPTTMIISSALSLVANSRLVAAFQGEAASTVDAQAGSASWTFGGTATLDWREAMNLLTGLTRAGVGRAWFGPEQSDSMIPAVPGRGVELLCESLETAAGGPLELHVNAAIGVAIVYVQDEPAVPVLSSIRQTVHSALPGYAAVICWRE